GRYFVGPTYSSAEIAVYGPDGRFLRVLGREGQGPGEFQGVRGVRVTGDDTLHVLSFGRHTAMFPDGKVISTTHIPLGFAGQFHILGDGRILVGAHVQTPSLIGYPAHLLDREGNRVRSFGSSSDVPVGFTYFGGMKSVGSIRGDRVWLHPAGEYRIELWDTAGTHRKTLLQETGWLKPWTRGVAGEPFRVKPQARLFHVHEDPSGRLWVIGWVPDRDWRPQSQTADYEPVHDCVVEVLDPETGSLLASQRFDQKDQLFYQFIEDGLVYSRNVEPETGVPLIHIWRMKLVGPLERRAPWVAVFPFS
ncbi:hypothetical protein ACFL3Z_01905, partial [Gemmatimonadota bacterium]